MLMMILRNTATGRFHPFLLRQAPMPGLADIGSSAQRYRSHGHHTDGFETLEEAQKHVVEACAENSWGNLNDVQDWDGDGLPLAIAFFTPETVAEAQAAGAARH